MSDFSQRLEKEIKNTGKTLYYLSEASGMQLDYISKMSKGKRIPKEEERLTAGPLMRWNAPEIQEQISCSFIARKKWKEPVAMYGVTDPYYPAGCGPISSSLCFSSVSGIPDTDMTLDNIFALYACIRKTKRFRFHHFAYVLRKFHWNIYDILFRLLHEVPYRRLEHLFPLLQNQTTENTLDNLRKICSLKPAMNYENYK